MTNEYVQAVYAEIIGDLGSTPPNAPAAPAAGGPAASGRRGDALLPGNTCRDAREQYHRMLLDAAGMIDTLVRELPSEIRSKAERGLRRWKAAPHPVTKMIAGAGHAGRVNVCAAAGVPDQGGGAGRGRLIRSSRRR
jgi:hypothetical protein